MEREHRKELQCTSPLTLIETLPSEQAKQVWEDVQTQLIRLDRRTKGLRTLLLPQDKIKVAQLSELQGIPNNQVAEELGVCVRTVKHAREDVRAAFFFVCPDALEEFGQSELKPNERRVLARLKISEEESQRVKRTLADPRVVEVLAPLPHLSTLLEGYSRYLTIAPLLTNVGIRPSLGRKMDYYSGFIRNFLLTDNIIRARKLAQRYLFASWLKTGEGWFKKNEINKLMLQTIVNIFSFNYTLTDFFINNLRGFFRGILAQEFNQVMTEEAYDDAELLAMFPGYSEKPAQSFDEVDLTKSWNYYASVGFIPRPFLVFVQKFIAGETTLEIANAIGIGRFYSDKTTASRFSAATTFLENILLNGVNGSSNQQLLRLTKRRKNLYQIAQKTIWAVDQELQSTETSSIQEV